MVQAEEEQPAGAPEWIVTFSDMISLLVTFFVMLMSFSTMNKREEMVIVGAFQRPKPGVIEHDRGPTPVDPPPNDRLNAVHPSRGAARPHSRPDEQLLENLDEMGQRSSDEHLEMDLTEARDGLILTFDRRATFAPGSVEVPPELEAALGELGRVFQYYEHLIVVEGYTDSHFRPTPEHPTAEALSAARAEAAARILLRDSGLDPQLVQIAGLGSERPRASNLAARERTLNRRVELRVLSLSKSRAEALQRARARAEAEESR
jgi:chemotaxis protein MotB